MRTLPASYLFLALPLLWQGVAYGQEEPAYTDTLDWRRFLPLEVGNEWQHAHYHVPNDYEPDCCDPQLSGMYRETIIGDSLSVEGVDSTHWFHMVFRSYDPDHRQTGESSRYYRYDTTYSTVISDDFVLDSQGNREYHTWPGLPDVNEKYGNNRWRLDGACDPPYDINPVSCVFDSTFQPGAYNSYKDIHGFPYSADTISIPVVKEFYEPNYDAAIGLDVGILETSVGDQYTVGYSILAYARIGDREIGMPILHTHAESESPARADPSFDVYPNPASTRVPVRLLLKGFAQGPVEISLYDILGRQMRTVSEHVWSPRAEPVSFDAVGLSAGVYFVRVASAHGSLTKAVHLTVP